MTRRRLSPVLVVVSVLALVVPWAAAAGPLGEVEVQATGGATAGFSADSGPESITVGPDGLVWFIEDGATAVGRVNADGSISEFPWVGPTEGFGNSLTSITPGPDGNLWFLDFNPPGHIAKITPDGVMSVVATGDVTPGLPNVNMQELTTGSDGNLWFTLPFAEAGVGRITPAGAVTLFPAPDAMAIPRNLTVGPDGDLWVTDSGTPGRIWTVDDTGAFTEQAAAGTTPGFTAGAEPAAITLGPDGNLWYLFWDGVDHAVARITPAGAVTEYNDPDLVGAYLFDIAPDCDRVWFTQAEEDNSDSAVWSVTPDGTLTRYTDGVPAGANLWGITQGPDGDMWVAGRSDPGRLLSVGTGPACGPAPGPTTTTVADSPEAALTPAAAPAVAQPVSPTFTG
jgi:streptogramin lyase